MPATGLPSPPSVAYRALGRILVAVEPARDREDRNLHLIVVIANADLAPIFVARLMRRPRLEPKVERSHAFAPHLFPFIADDLGVRRHRQPAPHRCGPARLVVHLCAAHVVHVVVEAVVGSAAEDDGLERARAIVARGHDQRVDGAPRLAHHADVAVAERQLGDLLDDLHARPQLVLGVLVGHRTVGVAAAMQVDAKTQVLVVRKPRIHHAVDVQHAVASAIRVEIDDRRKPLARLHRRRVIPVVRAQRQLAAARRA